MTKTIVAEKMISIIIAVYNSEEIVADTVTRVIATLEKTPYNFEILLINDGSTDNSWEVVKHLAEESSQVRSINFLKNAGQHSAVYCGIQHARGDYLVTMDDDLQNPPEELIKLIHKIEEGHDLVFGKFPVKRHSLYRRLGSKLVSYCNYKIFDKPKDLTLTNFRIFTREVGQRVGNYATIYPYIPGLLLMFSQKITNVETEHHSRAVGQSNYSMTKILALVGRLLFNYSTYPLKLLVFGGVGISLISFLAGLFYISRAFFMGSTVPGWTTIVVLLSFFNGFVVLMVGIIGEYLMRIINQISSDSNYIIKEIVE